MSFEPVDIFLSDPQGDPVENVLVKIYDAAGSVFFSQAMTAANGRASFLLETLTYSMRFYKFQTGFVQPQLFQILPTPETNLFEIVCEPYHMPIATDSRFCRCSGFFRNINGSPCKNLDIHFISEFSPLVLDDAAVITEEQRVRTDERGFASIDLIRCGMYNAVLEATGYDQPRCIAVPDLGGTNLPDLLFPRVEQIDWDVDGPFEMHVGELLVITPTVYDSAGRPLVGTASADVQWGIDPEGSLNMSVTKDTLEIRANGLGVTKITATRRDNTIIKIPNTPIAGVPVVITVT